MPANIHPLLVHFPIALLLVSVAFSWAGRLRQSKGLEQAAWYTLLVGLAATLLAVISGFVAARGVPAESPAMATLTIHRLLGIIVLVVFGLQAVCAWRSQGVYSRNKRILHTAIQAIGVALVVAVGFLGGELVYTFGVGVSAATP